MEYYPFGPNTLASCISDREVDDAQLRRDFDYPPNARDLELVQLEKRSQDGIYFYLLMSWREPRTTTRYNHFTREWEETTVWELATRPLEPRSERYL